MVYFVGAGPGAKDLITVRGMRLLEQADVIIYAGSLVNPELLSYAGSGAKIYDSAKMTLEEVLAVIREAEELAAEDFGAGHAFLMVGGTTSAVQAMILSCSAIKK